MKLLKELCAIHAPSGDESNMRNFLLAYIKKESKNWTKQPKVYHGDGFQDCIILSFGKPRTAIFAHMDSVGFSVRYNKELVRIGGPRAETGYELLGSDSKGDIKCKLVVNKENSLEYKYNRTIDRGTGLTFVPKWKGTKNYVQCCYMDNRLGVWNALKVAETLKDGIIVFSCWEEHGGGSVSFLQKFIYEKYKVTQALISDITWVTEGVQAGKGVAISLRDSLIPRKSYVNKVVSIAQTANIPFQLEVEGSGGSDAKELQMADIPWDWCFIGAPEQNVHSPKEKVHKADIASMLSLYKVLMKEL